MIKILSSNEFKLKEFESAIGNDSRFQLTKNVDIREVSGSAVEVILYKSLESSPNTIVEDSILSINGEEIVDIKYQMEKYLNLSTPANAEFLVSIGYNDGKNIYIFQSKLSGFISNKKKDTNSFGFDSVFYPTGSYHNLAELKQNVITKHKYSPRIEVLNKFVSFLDNNIENYLMKKEISTIPSWNGEYQI